jgi:hypothetical protein
MSLGQMPPLPLYLSPQLDLLLGLVVKLPYEKYHLTEATEQELSLMSNTYSCADQHWHWYLQQTIIVVRSRPLYS